ncbi:hypothetical protein SAMN05421766_102452 [Zobellia uliginosa]|uniref:Uncharacterized protein n=1 Tax=Zobellia uliginosa TaxID=143224 RepID=A0ABY1KRH6_9FLAO|nr:hypothetical protein SAMN05421766_102452 [Zobellia uliginosa]
MLPNEKEGRNHKKQRNITQKDIAYPYLSFLKNHPKKMVALKHN